MQKYNTIFVLNLLRFVKIKPLNTVAKLLAQPSVSCASNITKKLEMLAVHTHFKSLFLFLQIDAIMTAKNENICIKYNNMVK